MTLPYAVLRAGFPYLKTLGIFGKTHLASDVAFGSEGRLYILCKAYSQAIRILNLDDEDLGYMGTTASYATPDGPGCLVWPVQLILDSDENVYVSEEGSNRISVFNRDGEFLERWGERGSADGQLDRPSGIAFDADENMLVVDTKNHRVQKFTKDGKFLGKWGSQGQDAGELDMPWGIAIDEAGDVYISDWRNDRVQKFTSYGEFIFKFGATGSGDGEFNRPAGLDVDSDGDIYVADWGNDRVQLFDRDGRYVQKFLGDATLSRSRLQRMNSSTRKGLRMRDMANLELEKYLIRPRSVRVDSDGRMFIPDYGGYRVQVYEKEAYPLTEEQIMPRFRAETLQNF